MVKKIPKDDRRAAYTSGDRPVRRDMHRLTMDDQDKALISIEPARWGTVSKGGFPPSLFET
ncbi:MAG: hypothetical protein P8L46_16490 [Acidimicrobiales bacterium]|nr:hypothetical protein [Acidimicrobiales bacterium]MDG2219640.1 hypothetical protein [Acidimicrobiales bacterium]